MMPVIVAAKQSKCLDSNELSGPEDETTMSTMKEQPLWFQRLMLVLLSPLILGFILFDAFDEAWWEFRLDIASSWRDVKDIWNGK